MMTFSWRLADAYVVHLACLVIQVVVLAKGLEAISKTRYPVWVVASLSG